MWFKLLYYRIWIRDVFGLDPIAKQISNPDVCAILIYKVPSTGPLAWARSVSNGAVGVGVRVGVGVGARQPTRLEISLPQVRVGVMLRLKKINHKPNVKWAIYMYLLDCSHHTFCMGRNLFFKLFRFQKIITSLHTQSVDESNLSEFLT